MKKNIKILFVGNSLTYYNDAPEMVRRFFEAAGISAECVMLAYGGKDIEFHARSAQLAYNILYGNYDYVVLQDKCADFDPEVLLEHGKKIYDNFITKTNSKPVLYAIWPLLGEKSKQPMMTKTYVELAKQIGGIVAPAGEAWYKALRLRPAPELYMSDRNHPTPAGTYLASATIFYAITKRDRMLRLSEGKGLYTECGLDFKTATALNRIACEKAKEYAE